MLHHASILCKKNVHEKAWKVQVIYASHLFANYEL